MGRIVRFAAPAAAVGDAKAALSEARKRARPVLRKWQRRVELAIMAGELSSVDYLMAKELCNYPSANEGYCYGGQRRLGKAIGSSDRTARASLARLRARGFLTRKRGGPVRTATWTFCVNGKPIFGGAAFLPNTLEPVRSVSGLERQHPSAQGRQHPSAQERKGASAKPYEPKPFEPEPIELESSPPQPLLNASASGKSQWPPKQASSPELSLMPIHAIIDRIVLRLGRGDKAMGESIYYDELPADIRTKLKELERAGKLTDQFVESFLRAATGGVSKS
jgi:hypothetical protein